MACGADVRTSVGGVVVGEMMRVVPWYDSVANEPTHAGGAFGSVCPTNLRGGDRRMWSIMMQSHIAKPRQPGRDTCWSFMVFMLMAMFAAKNWIWQAVDGRSCLGNARCNVPRGRAIIRDQGSKIMWRNRQSVLPLLHNLQWQVVGGVSGDSHEFGIRPAYSHGVYTRPDRVPSPPHFIVTSPTALTGDSKGSCSVMVAIEEPTQNI